MSTNAIDQLDKHVHTAQIIEMDQLPGPAGLPVLGSLLQLSPVKLHRIFEKWSDQYGGIFKLKAGPITGVVITDPEANQYVLKHRPDKFRRLTKMDNVIREMGFSGVFNAEGDEWKRQRQLVTQALNMNHLTTFFPLLVVITEKLFTRWTTLASENQDLEIKKELMRYTVDITSRLAFGYNMNTIEKDKDIIQEHLENIFPAIYKRLNLIFPYWRYFKLPADKKVERSMAAIIKILRDIIDKTRAELEQSPALREKPTNFLQALIVDSELDGTASNEMVIGNVLTMMLAGEDTTAHTLTWIFYYMHLHPEVQLKMQQEADQVLNGNTLITSFEETARFPYIKAVAYEAMRFKPVAPLSFFNTLEDVVINNVRIPKNTGIFLQTLYASENEKNFSSPDQFIPERWIAGKCPHLNAHNERAFIPFGAGPRFCPGYNLAMIEITAVLAMVCKNFVVEMKTDPTEVKEIMAFTMMPSGFLVKLTKRS